MEESVTSDFVGSIIILIVRQFKINPANAATNVPVLDFNS